MREHEREHSRRHELVARIPRAIGAGLVVVVNLPEKKRCPLLSPTGHQRFVSGSWSLTTRLGTVVPPLHGLPMMIRRLVDLTSMTGDVRNRYAKVLGNLEVIAQSTDPIFADPRQIMLELVLANHEIEAANKIAELAAQRVALSFTSLIIPERVVAEGTLIRSVSVPWHEIVKQLGSNWRLAYEIPSEKWEEIIAGGFKKAGYDEVTLTPRSSDHGRDVIAIKCGFGCVKILGSVKANVAGNLVPYDAVRALVGVLAGERDA